MKSRVFRKKQLTLVDVKGASYGPTIQSQLAEERARKTSLESRGVGIVTSSGALATLLFGLAAFTRGSFAQLHIPLSGAAKWALIVAAVLFAGAAVLGVLSNAPLPYEEALVPPLRQRVEQDEWGAPDPIEAARRDARLAVDIIDSARKWNGLKAMFILAGIVLEALAGIAVAVAVYSELASL